MTDDISDGVGTYDVVLLVETAMSGGDATQAAEASASATSQATWRAGRDMGTSGRWAHAVRSRWRRSGEWLAGWPKRHLGAGRFRPAPRRVSRTGEGTGLRLLRLLRLLLLRSLLCGGGAHRGEGYHECDKEADWFHR